MNQRKDLIITRSKLRKDSASIHYNSQKDLRENVK